MTTPAPDVDEIYTRLLIMRSTRDAAERRFAAAGVLVTDWSDADSATHAGDPSDEYVQLDSDRVFARTNCQVALATVGSLVQRSVRDFVA
ncbi:MAG TPA: hypothetical protein VIL94_03375 [Acidothermaceae bacterium]